MLFHLLEILQLNEIIHLKVFIEFRLVFQGLFLL